MFCMPVPLISESPSSVSAAPAPVAPRRSESAIHAAAKLPTLREQLGYATDADLIAELREVLAINAATRFVKPAPQVEGASETKIATRKRAPR